MGRCKRGTFCCGAGGSHMWVEESRGERINNVRSSEAVETGADIISVACPFCMQMFESGLGSVPAAEERAQTGGRTVGVQVFDLAELLEQSVAYGRPVDGGGNGGGPAVPAPQAAPETEAEPVVEG
jgi:Fe-S oxidoreductase